MQITANTTGMLADLTVATDKDARDHCVVVVKGTFTVTPSGEMQLADEQRTLVGADQHHGDPTSSSVRYECDFALEKLRTDVVLVGKAVAPHGQAVRQLAVRLDVNGVSKDLMVRGERRWTRVLGSVVASDPLPFTELPITYERAWGGFDDSRGPGRAVAEPRNLVGVGFHPHRSAAELAGLPVPNVEALNEPISSPRGRYRPVGFGCVGRSWQPRLHYAGSYDARWRAERAPFLPEDFDNRYFQCAPLDQQFERFQGGEVLRCVHMAEQAVVRYVIPSVRVPVRFRFQHAELERDAVLDTVTLEPHLGLAMLVWRARTPLPKKLHALQEIRIGNAPARVSPARYRDGKPVFECLSQTVAWLKQQRRTP